ncbi:MAG: MFS transporter [Erysipelotrichaceae bacterium]|nr:MFS transporter [Erysipelotrichaceae bacterium]
MQNKKSMFRMMAVFFIYYLGFATPYVLMIPYLQQIGYSGSEQGIIIATGSLIGMIGQMIFGYLCDKYRSVKKFVYLGTVILLVSTWVFYFISTKQFFLHLAIGGFVQGLFLILCGTLDSWALEVDETSRENYGSIRAFGALGWIVGGPIVAYIVSRFDYSYLGYAYLVMTILAFAISYGVQDAQKSEQHQELKLSDVSVLLKNKRYVVLVLIFFLAFFILQAEGFLAVQKIGILASEQKETFISMKSSFQAIFELPFFFLGGYLIKRYGSLKLLMVALFAYMLRASLSMMSTEAIHIVYVSALQMLTYPLLTITSKEMVEQEIPDYLRSTGQQFAFSVYNCGAAFLAPLVGGIMMDVTNVNQSLLMIVFICILPILLCFVYRKMKRVTY